MANFICCSLNPKKRLAIECDGPPHGNPGQQKKDKEKQRVLENEGWTVWRIKHSQEENSLLPYPPFYSYPNWKKGKERNPRALDELWEELKRKNKLNLLNDAIFRDT